MGVHWRFEVHLGQQVRQAWIFLLGGRSALLYLVYHRAIYQEVLLFFFIKYLLGGLIM